MGDRIGGPLPTVAPVIATIAADVSPAPAAQAALFIPEPQAAVVAITRVPVPPTETNQAPTPAGVEALLALEAKLGDPSGEPVADAFAHTWIAELAT